jgi:hypothetical protein
LKNFLILLIAFCLPVIFSGCSAVYTESFLGEKSVNLNRFKLDGIWVGGNEIDQAAFFLKVLEPDKGKLKACMIDFSGNDPRFEKYNIRLREQGDWLIGHFKETDESENRLWFIATISETQITGWIPDASGFKKMAEADEIDGVVLKGGDVVLDSLSDETLEQLVNNPSMGAFNWENPIVINRVDSRIFDSGKNDTRL